MAHTAIGIFRDKAQAEAAVHRLMDNGFSRDRMDIAFSEEGERRGDVTDVNSTLDSKIGRFFLNVFEGDADRAMKYAAVGQRGVTIAIQADLFSAAQQAARILDACGALDVDAENRLMEDAMMRSDRTLQSAKQIDADKAHMNEEIDAAEAAATHPDGTGHDERPITGEHDVHGRVVDHRVAEGHRLREGQIWLDNNHHQAAKLERNATDDAAFA